MSFNYFVAYIYMYIQHVYKHIWNEQIQMPMNSQLNNACILTKKCGCVCVWAFIKSVQTSLINIYHIILVIITQFHRMMVFVHVPGVCN